jgi:Transposase IS4
MMNIYMLMVDYGPIYLTLTQETNGPVPFHDFVLQTMIGDTWRYASNSDRYVSRLDMFLQMFPALNLMWQNTNASIVEAGMPNKVATRTELIIFTGVILFSTKYKFGNRSNLRSARSKSKYKMTPQRGNLTGMRRQRYDFLYHHMRFSSQPKEQGDLVYGTCSWMLIDNFVKAFKDNRAPQIMVLDRLCVDESFSRWYGMGGSYINIGLPCYISMDQKPDDGCETWSCCNGHTCTGVMLQLKIVKIPAELELQDLQDDKKI